MTKENADALAAVIKRHEATMSASVFKRPKNGHAILVTLTQGGHQVVCASETDVGHLFVQLEEA